MNTGTAFPGSARFQRAGFGVQPKRTFVASDLFAGTGITESSRWQNAIASTLQACAPRILSSQESAFEL
jgi:hypothetical protein